MPIMLTMLFSFVVQKHSILYSASRKIVLSLVWLGINILLVIDSYVKLILVSWPAVVLILGILVIFRHRSAIDEFLKYIKQIGPKGVERDLPSSSQKDNEDEVDQLRKNAEELDGKLKEVSLEKYFERLYGTIYGGQLEILDRCNSREMIPYSEAAEIYSQALKNYPLLSTYDVHQYIGYLTRFGLIEPKHFANTDFVGITPMGRDFISYVKKEGLALAKMF